MTVQPIKAPQPLSNLQATLLSLLFTLPITIVVILLTIGYRDTTGGLYAVAGIFAFGLAAVIFLRPEIGAYVLAVSLVTNVSWIMSDNGLPGINKPLVALVFISILASRILSGNRSLQPIRFKSVELFMLVYGCVILASGFFAADRAKAFDTTFDYFKDFSILLCILFAISSIEQWKRLIWVVIASAAIPASLAVYQVMTGDYTQTFGGFMKSSVDFIVTSLDAVRIGGPVGEPNYYSMILCAIFPLVFYRLIGSRSLLTRFVALLATIAIGFAIITTYSRGGFITFCVMLLAIVLERRVRVSILVIVILLTTATVPFLPKGYLDRLSTLTNLAPSQSLVALYRDDSFRGRFSEMLSGVYMFVEHPILGVGAGNFPGNYQAYARRLGLEQRTEERDPHSLYTEVLAETGTLGVISFAGIFLALFGGLRQAQKRMASLAEHQDLKLWLLSLQIGLAAYLFNSIILHGNFIRYLWMLVSIGIAAIHLTDQIWLRTIESESNKASN